MAEKRFSRLTRALRAREPGDDRRSLTVEWMQREPRLPRRDLPRRRPAVHRAGREERAPHVRRPGRVGARATRRSTSSTCERAAARAIHAALAARSPDGARELAREHVLASFRLLETILEQVGRAR